MPWSNLRMYNYFIANNLLCNCQSGFLPGHSTQFQLIEIYHQICISLDKHEDFCMVFCDISKAFDRVWHNGLLFKLKQYGVPKLMIDWFQSYLSNRSQRVCVNGTLSSDKIIHAGVPQGSVLGPFLFLVYINDISDELKCLTRLFADDTSIGTSSQNVDIIQNSINDDLNNLNIWANKWLVNFNPNKTNYVYFSHRNTNRFPTLLFNDIPISREDSHKHLGVHFAFDTKWTKHIESIINSASKMISSMRKLKYKLHRTTLSKIYSIYIRPVLEYSSDVWSNCSAFNEYKLELLQLEAARIITGLTKFASKNSLYYETGWQPLSERRKNRKLITIYKIFNNMCPLYLTDLIPDNIPTRTNYNLRTNCNVRVPFARTATFKRSFIPSTLQMWNQLPLSTRNSTSINMFKSSITTLVDCAPNYYTCGNRLLNIIHTRLRHRCSNLNADLFLVNLSETMECHCGYTYENNYHYFIQCPSYAMYRHVMFDCIQLCGGQPDLNTILFGSNILQSNQNEAIFISVQEYIKKTKRFDK